MLARLAHFVARHRWPVIGVWIVLTLFGGFAAGQVSKRWYQSFSIPGKSAYEANQRTLKAFGVGVRPPNVVVFHTQRRRDEERRRSRRRWTRAAAASPGALTSSYFSTGTTRRTSRRTGTRPSMEIYPPGVAEVRHEERRGADRGRPRRRAAGRRSTVHVTGHDPLEEASDARRRAAARACCSRR